MGRFAVASATQLDRCKSIFFFFGGGGGGWYIENSLTTLNQKDPVSEHNTSLWNNGTESGKEIARKQKRRLNYISNIGNVFYT